MDSPSVSFPTLFEWQARLIERTARNIAHWISIMPQERLDWCPSAEGDCKGRSALDQVWECINANNGIAAYLKGEQPARPGANILQDAKTAGEMLVQSADSLANTIRNLEEGALTRTYRTIFGSMPGAVLLELPLNNMNYHSGQINYIQLLYGDKDFSIPPGFADFWGEAQAQTT